MLLDERWERSIYIYIFSLWLVSIKLDEEREKKRKNVKIWHYIIKCVDRSIKKKRSIICIERRWEIQYLFMLLNKYKSKRKQVYTFFFLLFCWSFHSITHTELYKHAFWNIWLATGFAAGEFNSITVIRRVPNVILLFFLHLLESHTHTHTNNNFIY
jgi:hypothetical protein